MDQAGQRRHGPGGAGTPPPRFNPFVAIMTVTVLTAVPMLLTVVVLQRVVVAPACEARADELGLEVAGVSLNLMPTFEAIQFDGPPVCDLRDPERDVIVQTVDVSDIAPWRARIVDLMGLPALLGAVAVSWLVLWPAALGARERMRAARTGRRAASAG